MTAWFLNSNSHSNDQNICQIKWSILSLTTGFYLRNCWLEKSRCQIYSCSEFTAQCHSWPSHQPWHWTDHRVTTQIKTSEPTKQRIRERDLHVWAPRPPWHDWVLPGGPGFPDTDIPELLLTNQWPVFWRVTNEEPGSFVWSSGTFHPSLVYCTITSNYPHQVNNAMLPSSENMITKAEGLKQLQLCIYTWKGGSKEDTNSREGLVNVSKWGWFAKCHFSSLLLERCKEPVTASYSFYDQVMCHTNTLERVSQELFLKPIRGQSLEHMICLDQSDDSNTLVDWGLFMLQCLWEELKGN